MRPRLQGAEKEYRKLYGVPSVPAWGHLWNPNHAPPPLAGGGGMVGTDPGHSLSGSRCPTHPPWGVGILSRQPQVRDLRDVVGLLLTLLFSSSLVASLYPIASLNGKRYRRTIQWILSLILCS